MADHEELRMKPVLDRIPDHWGKSLPDPGWDDLLLDLNERLAKLDPGYQIRQVKEKFGMLHFYPTFSDRLYSLEKNDIRDAGYRMIGEAEERSATICERCGQPGKPRQGSWIKTLCDEHSVGGNHDNQS